MTAAPFDQRFRRIVDWVDGQRSGTDVPLPFVDDQSLADIAWFESFRDAADDLALPTPPTELRARLAASFARHHRNRQEEQGTARPVEHPDKVSDSRVDQGLVGVRGTLHDTASTEWSPYELVYHSLSVTIFLEVRPAGPSSVDLTGQIVPVDEATSAFEVVARRSDELQAAAVTDTNGEFRMDALPVDVTHLDVENRGLALTLELELGGR